MRLETKDCSIKLRPKKKHPMICWVPGCKIEGEHFILSYETGEADVILCERHGEEALEAGQ
jgi:hypothetical protein